MSRIGGTLFEIYWFKEWFFASDRLTGDATIDEQLSLQKYRSKKGLLDPKNDESFKAAYDEAVAEHPEFKRTTVDPNDYGKEHIGVTFYSK